MFVLILLSIYVWSEISAFILDKYHGPGTKTIIETQFSQLHSQRDSIKCIVLSNSRAARGINPYMFSAYTYHFAHDFRACCDWVDNF